MQRLFRLAVEDDPIKLHLSSNVPDAVRELELYTFDLVITDLMLPGESGIGLMNRFSKQPALRNNAELVVLSAGMTAQQTSDLKGLGVDGFLLKPVSMARLRQLMLHGFSGQPRSSPTQTHPVAAYFEGNQILFDQFAAHCAIQFEIDCKHGDDSARRRDLSGLYAIAHTLGAALEMLGEKEMVRQCRELMDLTKNPEHSDQCVLAWESLGENLLTLSKRLRLKSLQ